MPIARAVPHSVAVHSRGEETGPPPGAIRSHPRHPRLAVLFAGCRSAAAALPAPVLARRFNCSSPRFDTVAMPIARAVPHSVAVHSRGEETGPPPGAIRSHPRHPRLAVLFAGCRSTAAALPAPVLARRFSCSSPRFDTVAMPIARAVPHLIAVQPRCEEGRTRRREQSAPIRVIRGSPFCSPGVAPRLRRSPRRCWPGGSVAARRASTRSRCRSLEPFPIQLLFTPGARRPDRRREQSAPIRVIRGSPFCSPGVAPRLRRSPRRCWPGGSVAAHRASTRSRCRSLEPFPIQLLFTPGARRPDRRREQSAPIRVIRGSPFCSTFDRSAAAALPAPVLARWFSCSSPRFDTVAMPIARAVPHSVAVHSLGEETAPPPGAIRLQIREDPRSRRSSRHLIARQTLRVEASPAPGTIRLQIREDPRSRRFGAWRMALRPAQRPVEI